MVMTDTKQKVNDAKAPQINLSPAVTTVFADSVVSINVVNGVARVVLGAIGPNNSITPTGQLMLPIGQFGNLAKIFNSAVTDLAAKMRDAQQQEEKPAATN